MTTIDSHPPVNYNPEQDECNEICSSSSDSESTQREAQSSTAMDDEENELKKAIALSLEGEKGPEIAVISETDEDLERALAESISEIKKRQMLQHSQESKKDERIIYDREILRKVIPKKQGLPVGLENVGSTCWFNVVVQALFHLPSFQSIVLKLSTERMKPSLNREARQSSVLSRELRLLFALMVGSNRSHINPSKCVNILQESFLEQGNESQQQDVSEFIHKLLDALELSLRCEHATGPDDNLDIIPTPSNNPIVQLFYGKSKTVGINNGSNYEQENSFGIFPLCVSGCTNLHDSLEYATALGSNHSEMWLTRLPPILTFQLSRFHFNQNLKKPEKIHDRLHFPSIIYMDRYLEENQESTRAKRQEAEILRKKLKAIKEKLNNYLSFSSNGKHFILTDILSACAEFASQKESTKINENSENVVRVVKKRGAGSSPSDGVFPNKRSREEDDNSAASMTSQSSEPGTSGAVPDGSEAGNRTPEQQESRIVERTLRNWKLEVEKQIADLKADYIESDQRLNRLYNESSLHKHPYALHAVLVHQGQALAGHYWAYVRDDTNQRWLKFNDTQVSEATYEELVEDSNGGSQYTATSAYCLIYLDTTRRDLQAQGPREIISEHNDLREYVERHNAVLEDQVRIQSERIENSAPGGVEHDGADSQGDAVEVKGGAWNLCDLRNAINKVNTTYTGMGAEKALEKNSPSPPFSPTPSQEENSSPASERFVPRFDFFRIENEDCPLFQACILAILKVSDTFQSQGPEAALLQAISEEMGRLKSLSEESHTLTFDPRLQNVIVYLYQNNAPRKVIERCILEQFADKRLKYDQRSSEIMGCATDKLNSLSPEDRSDDLYVEWREKYESFCFATCHLTNALRLFHGRHFFEAIQHFIAVHPHNNYLVAGGQEKMGVDAKLVGRYCRTCIKRVHEQAVQKLQVLDVEVAAQGLSMMRSKLIPCVSILLNKRRGGGAEVDLQLADLIRDEWCCLIEQTIIIDREELSSALTEFLDVNSSSCQRLEIPTIDLPVNLSQEYEQVMSSLLKPPAA